MPIFEYRCKDCTHTFEKLVSASNAAAGQECPECQSHNSMKLLSVFAAQGAGAAPAASGVPAPARRGGCGSGCGCH